MSNKSEAAKGYINQLVVKAIEKKKQHEERLAQKNKPRLDAVLFSQFELLDTVHSKSGTTTVYHLANKDQPEKQIACKAINEATDEIAVAMLVDEANKLKASQHPNVAQFIKFGDEFDRAYLMYDWVQGESLAQKLAYHSTQAFRHDHIVALVTQLASALEFMHTQGVCHLDIKPANIVINEDDSAKLIDFGAARFINDDVSYAEASLRYASPLYIETGKAEPQDDVYSLALLTGHLLLGSLFGDAWQQQLNARKRPVLIPSAVWKLLKQVMNNPRGHGYSAMSFAQELAYIDMQPMGKKTLNSKSPHVKSKAPIFSRQQSVNALLANRKLFKKSSFPRFKILEASLVFSVLATTGHYVYQHNASQSQMDPGLFELNANNTMQAEHVSSFLTQSPWKIESELNAMQQDKAVIYRQAYQVQQTAFAALYDQRQVTLSSYQELADDLPKALAAMRKELVTLREKLVDDGALFSYADATLANVMTGLTIATVDSVKISSLAGSKAEQVAQLILGGKATLADEELQTAWSLKQAQAYFYSHALSTKVMEKIEQSIENYANNREYTQAIEAVKAAQKYFGQSIELNKKINDLVVARSEYILFSTATEKTIFDNQALHAALDDLKQYAPDRFVEMMSLLESMATDTIEKGHLLSRPARGAVSVKQALKRLREQEKG